MFWSWSAPGDRQRPRTHYFRYFLRCRHHREQRGQCGVVEGPRKSLPEGFVSEMGETEHNKTKRQQRWMRSQAPAFGAAAFDCNQLQSYKVCCVGATFPFVPLEVSLCPDARSKVPCKQVLCGPAAGPWYTQKGNGVQKLEPPETLPEGQMAAAGSSNGSPRSAAMGALKAEENWLSAVAGPKPGCWRLLFLDSG